MFECPNYIKKFIGICTFVALFTLPTQVYACIYISSLAQDHLDYLVRKTKNIVVATVVNNSDYPPEIKVEYGMTQKMYLRSKGAIKFKTVEVLKGESAEIFTLPKFYSCFWDREFFEGETYLIIENGPIEDSYLRVELENDLWTLTVKTQIASPDKLKRPSQSLEDWVVYSKMAFIGVVDNCQTPRFKINKMLKGKFAKSEIVIDEMLDDLSAELFKENGCVKDAEVYGFQFSDKGTPSLYYRYIDGLNVNSVFGLTEIAFPNALQFIAKILTSTN